MRVKSYKYIFSLALMFNIEIILSVSDEAINFLGNYLLRFPRSSYGHKINFLRFYSKEIEEFKQAFTALCVDVRNDSSLPSSITFPDDLLVLNSLGLLDTITGKPSKQDFKAYCIKSHLNFNTFMP